MVPGVYTDWPTAQKQIHGVKGPKYKKFATSAEAAEFVRCNGKGASQSVNTDDAVNVVRPIPPKSSGVSREPPHKLRKVDTGSGNKSPSEKTITNVFQSRSSHSSATNSTALRIYTDGSSLSNGNNGASAGVGVFFGIGDDRYVGMNFLLSSAPKISSLILSQKFGFGISWIGYTSLLIRRENTQDFPLLTPSRNVSEPLQGPRQTNQRAELSAIDRALEIVPTARAVQIVSDSQYSINCVTKWYIGWEKNGWMNAKREAVENQDLIRSILARIRERQRAGTATDFIWVKGHSNDAGNEAADMLAVAGARRSR